MLQNELDHAKYLGRASANICLTTQRICLDTARYCMETGEDFVDRQFIRLLLDTAALCHATMDAIYRATWLHAYTISACAAMCARVAEACDNFPNDDKLIGCARACRACLKYCVEASTLTPA